MALITLNSNTPAKASDLNTNFAGLANGTEITALTHATTALANPYKFMVYRNAAQNTSAASTIKLNCDTEVFDTNGNFDSATNYRYTAPVAGFYFLGGAVHANSSSSRLIAFIYKNGVEALRGSDTEVATAIIATNVGGIFSLAAGDYVEFYFYAGSTVSLEVGSATRNYFYGFLISRT